jgi:RHS repeat-associated protein
VTTNYTLDLNTGLTQVLSDGTTDYLYGNGRIAQVNTSAEYFLGDALGSVRQMTDASGEITFARGYDPYGVVTYTTGTSQTECGFTGEQYDTYIKLIYLRSRLYSPDTGRFLTKDSWLGDYNKPLSFNRWNYTNGNPVNYTDPSGHSPVSLSQVLSSSLSQYAGSSNSINFLTYITDCSPLTGKQDIQDVQYDLTGYLALAMTKHGQDARVKLIATTLDLANLYGYSSDLARTALWGTAYLAFYNLEGGGKEWDIKVGIKRELKTEGIILCGLGFNCKWVDYSVPGNVHFGYVAYLAKIDYFVAAIAGGLLEQKDLYTQNLPLEPLYCFQNAFPGHCDNPQDQAAVDFGYMLGKKYGKGITDQQLRRELNTYALWSFQKPSLSFPPPHQAIPQPNVYEADDFNN